MRYDFKSSLLSLIKKFYRKNHVSIDELVLHNNLKQLDTNFISLSNLFIEGALYDGSSLIGCTSDCETINGLPNFFITWMLNVIKLFNLIIFETKQTFF